MELANGKGRCTGVVEASGVVPASLARHWRNAAYLHQHADWRPPEDWLGRDVFLAVKDQRGRLRASLAVIPDPTTTTAAWVRLATFDRAIDLRKCLPDLMQAACDRLSQHGVTQIGWLSAADWVDKALPSLRFSHLIDIHTWYLEKWRLPTPTTSPHFQIRALQTDDFLKLVEIERLAFDPLWQHSPDAFKLAAAQALHFTIATVQNKVVGFQYTVAGRLGSAHLVRVAVAPAVQGAGIGSALLADLLAWLQSENIEVVTLNTQQDNRPSLALYRKFGFRPSGDRYPVWTIDLP